MLLNLRRVGLEVGDKPANCARHIPDAVTFPGAKFQVARKCLGAAERLFSLYVEAFLCACAGLHRVPAELKIQIEASLTRFWHGVVVIRG
jgi:hypothetical protein